LTVTPEGAPLGPTAPLLSVAPPDEPPSESCIAPDDEPPLDDIDGRVDPEDDVEPVPLLVPPLAVPLWLPASPNDGRTTALDPSPPCSWTPQHAASSEMANHCPTAAYLDIVKLGPALRRLSSKLTTRFGIGFSGKQRADGVYPSL
jgi:hypothetical protein